ncbi:MAG: aryl-sulfate sulfotransferase [Myxococcota bacterium]
MLALTFAACVKDPEPTVIEATGAPSELVPTVLHVAFDGEGTGFVEYGLDGFDLRTPDDAGGATHDVAVLGLKAAHAYQWRAVVVDADRVRSESEPGSFDVPAPPAELLPVTVTVADEAAELQYFLASVIRPDLTSFAAIMDRDGDWVWWASSDGTVMVTPELGVDGASIAWGQYDFGKYLDIGRMVRVSLDGTTRTETRLPIGHHDFVQHDDGTVAFLGISFAEIAIGDTTYAMASDTISVIDEGSTAETSTPIFDMFADFPLEPEVTCDHIAHEEPKLGQDAVHEWTHGNSFMFVPEDDAYYVNDKFTDWLIKVDRATGAPLWKLNGRGSEFTQPNGDPVWVDVQHTSLWSHGHMSDIWSGGGMMFDNGDHHVPTVSRAIEFAWDEAARTAEIVWEYPHPEGLATAALGDVRRMPLGDVLITWAGLGEITEVTRDGAIVWRAEMDGDRQLVGRLVPITDLYDPHGTP